MSDPIFAVLPSAGSHIPEDGYLLRIFVGESDRAGHHPLYEAIVLKAREMGLAGATVTRGVMAFGKHSLIPHGEDPAAFGRSSNDGLSLKAALPLQRVRSNQLEAGIAFTRLFSSTGSSTQGTRLIEDETLRV